MTDALSIYTNRSEIETRLLAASRREAGTETPCVSIYLPRQNSSHTVAQRKFRLIRLLKQAERLITQDYGPVRAKQFVTEFWRCDPTRLVEQYGLSIAFFHDQDFTGAIPLPMEVEERVVVAQSFHIKPLLAWLQSAPPFWLISLSTHQVRLFEGNPWEIKLREVIEHASGSGEPTRGTLTKEQVRQFFLRAEEGLHPILREDRHPIVIAGVAWLHPIYRRISRDPDLVAHAIYGNVERWGEEKLRLAAFETLSKLLDRAKKEAIAEFERLAWTGNASDDLVEVARAAVKGRVRKIILASDQMLWGKLHPKSGNITLHPHQLDTQDDDILDDLAEIVLANGGKVLCVPSQDLPTGSPVAAVMTA
jgi:hypothetical protein